MAVLKKSAIKPPVVPKETVDVPELGGEVVVRGLLLSEKLALFAGMDDAGRVHTQIGVLLAETVRDADDLPVYSTAEWEAFGARNHAAALRLFGVARRLSGLDAEAAEKN